MNDSTGDRSILEMDGDDAGTDYRLREVEARLHRRLDVLESERRRMRGMARALSAGLVGTLVVLIVLLWKIASDGRSLTTTSLSAQEITLRDGNGVTRGHLGTDAEGRTQFSLSDRDGRGRIRLTVLADGSPGLTFTDGEARPRAVLAYLADGTTSLVFADAQGTSRAVVGLEPDGSTHALFSDRDGTIRTLLGVGLDGEPFMTVLQGRQSAAAPQD